MNLSFGSELEFADVRYGQPLPEGCSWNRQDYSIVNSNGIANCPTGKYYGFGGEINTRPTESVKEQVDVFQDILVALDPQPVINYRCNLHIHVGIKDLRNDLAALKNLLTYTAAHQLDIFQYIELIPRPTYGQYPKTEEYKGAMKRYRRRHQSHQSVLSVDQVHKMLLADSTEEFYLSHFVTDKNGVPQKQLHQRCGINFRSLWENNETIEFRHFPGTTSPKEFFSCVAWCEEFVKAALETEEPPLSILKRRDDLKFPKFVKYEHVLELGYEATSHHLPAKKREENIKRLLSASS